MAWTAASAACAWKRIGKQIFVDGVYHADPHPGTSCVRRLPLARPDPRLCSSTSGPPRACRKAWRKGIVTFLQGAMTRDVGARHLAQGDGLSGPPCGPTKSLTGWCSTSTSTFRAQMRFEGFSLST